eukprot:544878_1
MSSSFLLIWCFVVVNVLTITIDDTYDSKRNCTDEHGGMNLQRLSLLEDYMKQRIENKQLSGASIAVFRKNVLVYESFEGYLNTKQTQKIDKDTIFRIYSMTKPVIAVGLMMLYEQNKFKLIDPLSKYIPAFKKENMNVYDYEKNKNINLTTINVNNIATIPLKNDIQIWHLLTHTAGFSYGLDYENGTIQPVDRLYEYIAGPLLYFAPESLEDFTNNLAKLPLLFEPGTRYEYGYPIDICGRLIEVISGQTLDVYLKENIFKPLNMDNTTFKMKDINKDNLAEIYYQPVMGEPMKIYEIGLRQTLQYTDEYKFLSGGAGLLSTLHNYLSFTKMLLNNGELNGVRLLSRKTVEYMMTNRMPENKPVLSVVNERSLLKWIFNKNDGFGLGFGVKMKNQITTNGGHFFGPLASVGTYGWAGVANTYFVIDPEEELCYVWMTQLFGASDADISHSISRLIYSAIDD